MVRAPRGNRPQLPERQLRHRCWHQLIVTSRGRTRLLLALGAPAVHRIEWRPSSLACQEPGYRRCVWRGLLS